MANAAARAILRPDRNVLLLVAATIEPRDRAASRPRINNVGIPQIRRNVAALSPARIEPVLATDIAIVGAAGDTHGRVVLLRTVHFVEKIVVRGHVIKLRRRLVVLRRPVLAAI